MCLYTALKLQEYIFLWTWKLESDGKGSIFSQWKLDGCSIILARKTHWVIFLFITTAALVMILSFLKQADCHFLLGSYLTVQFHLSHKWHDGLWWMVSDSWSPKERILLWHQRGSFSHSELRELFITVKKIREIFWPRYQKQISVGQRVPHSLVLSKLYVLFQLVTNSREIFPDPFPQHTSSDNRISQKFLVRKEKHVLRQDTLLLYNH